ncbi:MAG: DMT family transporter [Simkaniaceae bacterium]|nr:DMT family transporter [Simkaniaceae bacterium]
MNHKTKIITASISAVLAAAFLAIMSGLTKIARAETSLEMALFFRFTVGFLISLPFCLSFKNFSFRVPKLWLHILRAIMAFSALFCLFYALKYLPLFNVLLLGITYPLFIPILVYFFFRRRLSIKMILGISLGFVGVIFVLQPDASKILDFHSFIAILAGFLIAVTFLIVRVLHRESSSAQINFYYPFFAMLCAWIFAAFNWEWPSAHMLPILIAMGVTGVLYQFLIVYALKLAHASLISPLMYTSILFSALFEWAYWGDLPNAYGWFGFALIFCGACITVWIGGQMHHLTKAVPKEKD